DASCLNAVAFFLGSHADLVAFLKVFQPTSLAVAGNLGGGGYDVSVLVLTGLVGHGQLAIGGFDNDAVISSGFIARPQPVARAARAWPGVLPASQAYVATYRSPF